MASIHVDPAALRDAAAKIDAVAARFTETGRDGEQPQPAPESANPGFWETVGGIGIAILGGIGWVGEHAAHPFS